MALSLPSPVISYGRGEDLDRGAYDATAVFCGEGRDLVSGLEEFLADRVDEASIVASGHTGVGDEGETEHNDALVGGEVRVDDNIHRLISMWG